MAEETKIPERDWVLYIVQDNEYDDKNLLKQTYWSGKRSDNCPRHTWVLLKPDVLGDSVSRNDVISAPLARRKGRPPTARCQAGTSTKRRRPGADADNREAPAHDAE